MSKALQKKICCTRNISMYTFLGTQILVMLETGDRKSITG